MKTRFHSICFILVTTFCFANFKEGNAWARSMSITGGLSPISSSAQAKMMWERYPEMTDWFIQDNTFHSGENRRMGYDSRKDFYNYMRKARSNALEKQLIEKVCRDLGKEVPNLDYRPRDYRWFELYAELCLERKAKRLAPLMEKTDKIIYATHSNMGDIYLSTSTAVGAKNGSQLKMIDLAPLREGKNSTVTTLFDAKNGIVRDPEISFCGKKMLFSWRKTNKGFATTYGFAPLTGNYKIYEMDLETRAIRQLTFDDTYGADIEPCYLPNGDIAFSSDRCVQEVTCGWGDGPNMYIMNKDGKYVRRVGFDQTQTAFPHLLNDGRIVYTRRDYNDRGQTYAHALFVMNPDGTAQTEYYGNNTCEPTSWQHTRAIPGSHKSMSIAGGYHTTQGGKLCIVDPNKGRQDYDGLEFFNWDPNKKITSDDHFGREGEQYGYPYPLSENDFLVSYDFTGGYAFNKEGRVPGWDWFRTKYKVYYMTMNGEREMLASDPIHSCQSPVPVMAREVPSVKASSVDYRMTTGTMYVQDVYHGEWVKGVKKGEIKKIRVSELHYKPVTIGGACWAPPRDEIGPGKLYSSFGQHSVTPVGVASATFDAKTILGEIDVHEDGSAMFEVPARKPIYLQLLNKDNEVVQTMRSWATLMPNEYFSCVGCHENKVDAPKHAAKTIAMQQPAQKLKPFHDISGKPFSYAKMVQPIWDKHCISCHDQGKSASHFELTDRIVLDRKTKTLNPDETKRKFYVSYLNLLDANRYRKDGRLDIGVSNKWVNYYTRLLTVEKIPAYYAGSIKSGLIDLLRDGHKGTKLSDAEIDTVSAWIDLNVPFIGEYDEQADWDEKEWAYWDKKWAIRKEMDKKDLDSIQQMINDGYYD